MERFCLGVFAAVLVATLLPELPSMQGLCLFCVVISIVGYFHRYFHRYFGKYFRGYFCCGFLLFLVSLSAQVHWHQSRVTRLLASSAAEVHGTIVTIPQQYGDSYFFLLEVARQTAMPFGSATDLIAVRWFDATEQPFAGQRWQFSLKLKAVRGMANPSSGNKESAAFVHGIIAQGTVVTFQKLSDTRSLRQQAFTQLNDAAAGMASLPLLLALTVGERPFTPELWLALQSSGLSHVISISGMHIGLVFGWILLLKPIFQRLPIAQLWRERLLWGLALAAALIYCLFAGFAIPTWRALLAIVIITALRMLLRRTSGWRFSLVFTALLLLWWPTLMLSLSFWLSVSAVALLFFLQWRFAPAQTWRETLRQFVLFQWVFTCMLLPISLLFFHGVAPLAFLCNLLFVPWISMVGIPLLLVVFLLQFIWPSPLTWLWILVDWCFRPLVWLFEQLDIAKFWWSLPQIGDAALITLFVAALVWAGGQSRVATALALVFTLPAWLHWQQPPANALHVVDVGQGTAIILQQQQRALVYDVGPKYGDYSATRNHLLPYLRYLGIQQLDYLILSHNDSDHTGHWQLLQQAYPKLQLVTDIQGIGAAMPCRALPTTWGDFSLQVLWPHQASKTAQPRNEDSCVVMISHHATKTSWRMLVTGDADIAAERQILTKQPSIRADVLILGHHGSKTSSDLAFLKALQLKIALNSAGYDNPYRHPSDEVLAKLSLLQIPLYTTADMGAIRLELHDEHLTISTWRQQPWLAWVEKLTRSAESPNLTR